MSMHQTHSDEIARRIGKRIRVRRTADGSSTARTQQDLADAAGISVSFLSMIERGERLPTLETLYHLAEALKMKPSELLD